MAVAVEHEHKRSVFGIFGELHDEIMLYGIECAGIPVVTDKGNILQLRQCRLRSVFFASAAGKQSVYQQKRTKEQECPALYSANVSHIHLFMLSTAFSTSLIIPEISSALKLPPYHIS